MKADTQFSVFLVNKPGVLAGVTETLGKARINIIALTMMDSSEHGVLRMVVDDADKARDALGKAHDNWTETDVLVMTLPNRPGAFAAAARQLAEAHVNISYAYTSGGAPGGKTTCVLKVADMKKAMKLLSQSGKKTSKAPARQRRASAGKR